MLCVLAVTAVLGESQDSEAGSHSAVGGRYGRNFRTDVTSMTAEASSGVHKPPVPRGDRDGALGWKEEDTRGLAAAPEPPRLSLLPGELVAFVFLARMSLLQGRHLIVPLTSSRSRDHISKDHGLFVREKVTVACTSQSCSSGARPVLLPTSPGRAR